MIFRHAPLVGQAHCAQPYRLSQTARVDDADAPRLATRESSHHGAQSPGRAAGATDDPTEVIGVDADFENLAAAQVLAPDSDILVVVDDALDQVLQRLVEHDQTSGLATSEALSALASALASAFSTFGSALASAFSTFGSALASAFSTFGSALASAFSTFGSALASAF